MHADASATLRYIVDIISRAFVVAEPHARNSLPQFVTDCTSPLSINKYLNIYLFSLSYQSTNQTTDSVEHPCSSLDH